jgi:NAD(P)-dependent dehydrogenase (short-subunit alcohol dehydrogenase family)
MSYLEERFQLDGIKAVVTGGAGVIPSAMAKALAATGADVCVWGRGTNHPVSEAVEALEKETGRKGHIFGVTVDTSTEEAVTKALRETEDLMGIPNVLVNGVGGNLEKSPFVDLNVEKFQKTLELNLLAGLVIPTKIFAARWIEAGTKASIINIASMTSYTPLSGVWAYGAAKTGVMNLTVGTAKELAPHGIRVNGIAPGFFLGYQNKALLVKNDETGELTDRGQQIISRTPMGRFGDVSELEGVTVFLASPAASGFITGVTIPVDGGFLTDNV